MPGPGFAGDANNFIMGYFTHPNQTPFTGPVFHPMHEVSFDKRETFPMVPPPNNGQPTSIEFQVSSTLGHLVQNTWAKWTFSITLPRDKLEKYLNKATENLVGFNADLAVKKSLENILLHPVQGLSMLNNIELRQNGLTFQNLRTEHLQIQRREEYNMRDHELQTRLINGGLPAYHFCRLDESTNQPVKDFELWASRESGPYQNTKRGPIQPGSKVPGNPVGSNARVPHSSRVISPAGEVSWRQPVATYRNTAIGTNTFLLDSKIVIDTRHRLRLEIRATDAGGSIGTAIGYVQGGLGFGLSYTPGEFCRVVEARLNELYSTMYYEVNAARDPFVFEVEPLGNSTTGYADMEHVIDEAWVRDQVSSLVKDSQGFVVRVLNRVPNGAVGSVLSIVNFQLVWEVRPTDSSIAWTSMVDANGVLSTVTGTYQPIFLNGSNYDNNGSPVPSFTDFTLARDQGVQKRLSYYPFLNSQLNGGFKFIGGMHDGYGSIPDQYDDKCQLLRHEWHPGQHWDKFIPTWFHEIGLKDVIAYIPGTLKDHVLALYGGQTFDFPIVLDIPHPFHYKPASSVASLNFVNDLEILLYFNDYRMWIQNYKDVAEFAEFKVDKFSLITQYYNVPRGVWDSNFPLRAQLNYPANDWIMQDKIETIRIKAGDRKTLAFNVNTFDRVARYFVLSFQPSTFYQSNDSRYMPHVYLDMVHQAWLEISGDKIGTKIQTDVDVFRKFQERYTQFSETYSHYPGELIFLPLGFDCDIHNPGGGAMNIRPVSTNLNIMYVVDGDKIKRLYESGCHYTTNTKGTATQLQHCKSRFSNGSTYGAIEYNDATQEYVLSVRVRCIALTLNIVTYHNGQMYSQY